MAIDQERETFEVTAKSVVSLRNVTKETVHSILRLNVGDNQQHVVAPNAVSIAEAYFEPKAWFRAIYADETPVGFVMLYDDAETQHYYLWRYMIDARYQSLGLGRRALEQVIDYVRMRPGARHLYASYVPGNGSPVAFYEKLGFVHTGEEEDGELVIKLEL